LIAPIVPGLSSRCPDLFLHISEEDPEQALRSVEAGTADLALTHDADGLLVTLSPALTQRHVHTDVGDVVLHRSHSLAQLDRPLTVEDLAGHAWVTSPPGTVCHQWFRRLFADAGEDPDVRHLIDDFSTQLSLVAFGDVIALVPRLARPPLREDLVAMPLLRKPKREVYAAWRRSAHASPALQEVLKALAAGQQGPEPD
jgi:DNA-binding transcriptional LysR family regulator